ncbi:T9SS type A sorting domain-containing protein [Hymenobacter sp. APR13]|uniref:T9SS type A sorting domain-containing protein n=1 Tax=Hymenobacter sp. APR13 TaxID=1356852 RepID=UPI003977AC71
MFGLARPPQVVTVEFSVINSTRYATLTLVDALGQAVRSQSTQFLTTTDIKAEMSLAGLAPGFYWLRIQAGDKQVNRALIVE